MCGVEWKAYEAFYEKTIQALAQEGLLEVKEDRIRLTERGIDVSNYVLAQFLMD